MAKNIFGGGSQTNANGLRFEQETDLVSALRSIPGYSVTGNDIYFLAEKIAVHAAKSALYRVLLEPEGVDATSLLSKRLLPDEAVYVLATQTVFIIEKKFQNAPGSVDEKLQTCDFKKRQYTKLFAPIGLRVEYMYVLNDWFSHPGYGDVLEYIQGCGCHYFFNEIPLSFLGIPAMEVPGTPEEDSFGVPA